MFGLLTVAGYWIGKTIGGTHEAGSTCAFIVLSLSQIIHSYNMRSDKSLFKIGMFTNKKLNIVNLISVALIAFVIFIPGVVEAFGMCYLSWQCYLIAVCLSLLPLLLMEISKAIGLVKHEHHKHKK